MVARPPARFTAPLALLVVVVAFVVIVTSNGSSDSSAPSSSSSTKTHTSSAKAKSPAGGAPRRTYVVAPGDSLNAIAAKTGVSSARLTALNPKLDPQSLQVGERIRLRP